jgi:hypothetical protein
MTAATTDRAEYLKSPEKQAVATDAVLLARWGAAAADSAQSSPLAEEAPAAAEAARQLALLGRVMAEDELTIEGVLFDLEGETITVDYRHPGGGTYFGGAASVAFLVTFAAPDLAAGTTAIRGLIQL